MVFLDVYPKRGPLQQITIADAELKMLLKEFIEEAHNSNLKEYNI